MGIWEVEVTDQFHTWWDTLSLNEQAAITVRVEYLAQTGPSAKRPVVGEIRDSRHANMKELRASAGSGSVLRVLFAFDPRSTAILLLGGNKAAESTWERWYPSAITEADELYDTYLQELTDEGLLPPN